MLYECKEIGYLVTLFLPEGNLEVGYSSWDHGSILSRFSAWFCLQNLGLEDLYILYIHHLSSWCFYLWSVVWLFLFVLTLVLETCRSWVGVWGLVEFLTNLDYLSTSICYRKDVFQWFLYLKRIASARVQYLFWFKFEKNCFC